MENLNLALVSSPKPFVLGHSFARDATDREFFRRKALSFGRVFIAPPLSRYHVTRAAAKSHQNPVSVQEKQIVERFASISSSSNQGTTSSIGVNPQFSSPPSSTIGSPLFWIGVGVGLSALFTMKYAMQQAFKTMMGQMNPQSNPFDSAAFSGGSPFPFPMPSPSVSGPAAPTSFAGTQYQAPSASTASRSSVTVDLSATKVEAAPATNVKDEVEVKNEPKKIAFVDVSPEETVQKSPFESFKDEGASSFKEAQVIQQASQNGAPFNQGFGNTSGSQSTQKSPLSVDALEKMMEDPTVQKMVYPDAAKSTVPSTT
ncbi:hypothetical protein TanjilG_21258 [Lupinus angustifolius]|uniref:Uncharacterized protein n=1 Tax=Lupinus angustifolius TaxID=3871 RepID=A0A4P1RMP3_LUPAN|nr:hypothetical protein TanjilG_21258 [Lupinus angustifolius]